MFQVICIFEACVFLHSAQISIHFMRWYLSSSRWSFSNSSQQTRAILLIWDHVPPALAPLNHSLWGFTGVIISSGDLGVTF